jgi:hypothetical protein
MDDQRERNLEWLTAARDTLRKKAGRFNLKTTFYGLGIFLATIFALTLATGLHSWFVSFPQQMAETAAKLPDLPGWDEQVAQAVGRWRATAVKWQAISYLGSALIAAIPFVIVSMLRDDLTHWLRSRVLHLPRHRAVGFVIESVEYRFRTSETRRFAMLLFASIGTFTLFLLLFHYDRRMEGAWLAQFWFAPLIAAVPVVLLVQRFATAWRRVLEKMRLTSADVERFRLVRLIDAAVPLVTYLFVLAVLLASVPHLLARGREQTRQAEINARSALDEWVETRFEQAPPTPEQAQRLEAYSQPPRPWGDQTQPGRAWLDDFFPAAVRFFGGAVLATAGVFVLLLFAQPARTHEQARAGGVSAMWIVGGVVAAAISISWAYSHVWAAWQMMVYQGVALVGLIALGGAKVWWTLTRQREVCPSCDRTFVTLGDVCPVCGVNLPIAKEVGADEFVVGQGLTTVHHHSCRIYRKSASRAWKKFMTLRQALLSVEAGGLAIARPCKVCLGSETTWTGDPVWRSARNWARWIRRDLPSPPENA